MNDRTIVGLLLVCCVWGADARNVADTLRVTEDAVEKPLAKVGLVGTVTRLLGLDSRESEGCAAVRASK